MTSVAASNFSVWIFLFNARAWAHASPFEFVQASKENLFVLAFWNSRHSIGTVMNLRAQTRVLRTAGREELYESLDTFKPLAHCVVPPVIEAGGILSRFFGD